MTIKYYVDDQGIYLGAFDGDFEGENPPVIPEGAIEVPDAPQRASQIWDGTEWSFPIEDLKTQIDVAMSAKLRTGILWAFSAEEAAFVIRLDPQMRETLAAFKQLLAAGEVQPHGGFIRSDGVTIRAPGSLDLSDTAISEVCTFAGLWALAISRVAILQKELIEGMTTTQLQAYDPTAIDWTVTWDAQIHPDWSDNLVLQNP